MCPRPKRAPIGCVPIRDFGYTSVHACKRTSSIMTWLRGNRHILVNSKIHALLVVVYKALGFVASLSIFIGWVFSSSGIHNAAVGVL